jgi:hypothetical protein
MAKKSKSSKAAPTPPKPKLTVHVIHAAWLTDRASIVERLREALADLHFRVEVRVVSEHDPPSLDLNRLVAENVVAIGKEESECEDEVFKPHWGQTMHVFQLSNALKHAQALRDIAESKHDGWHLVVEDDVLFDAKQLSRHLGSAMALLEKEDAIAFAGLPAAASSPDMGLALNANHFTVLPYCDSYLIRDVSLAKRLADAYLPISFANHVQMSWALKRGGVASRITAPNLFVDGSKAGTVVSVLNVNNELVFHKDYMEAKRLLLSEEGAGTPSSSKQRLESIFASSGIRQHPDMVALLGRYRARVLGDWVGAQKALRNALDVAMSRGAPVDRTSGILKDLIATYRHTQDDKLWRGRVEGEGEVSDTAAEPQDQVDEADQLE